VVDLTAPKLIVTAPTPDLPEVPASVQRLSAVRMPEYARPRLSDVQRERLEVLEVFEAPHNLTVADYAKLAGKSRRWITYEIQAGNLLSIHMGHRGQRVPDWQLDPLKRRLVQSVLKQVPRGVDTWQVYHSLLHIYDELGPRPAIEVVRPANLHLAARLVITRCVQANDAKAEFPAEVRQTVRRLVQDAITADAAEDVLER
jgi:hypothetical protein